jgi:hypothetical protein
MRFREKGLCSLAFAAAIVLCIATIYVIVR